MKHFALLPALLALPMLAAEVRVTDRILPFIQDGGGAWTTITVVNLESTPSNFELLFLTDTAAYWPMPVVAPASVVSDGSYVRATLAAGRSVTFRTNGIDAATGHATIFSPENARLGVTMRVNPTGWTFTSVPQREDVLVLPFDNTDGAATAFLWISDTPSTLVNYTVLGEDGTILSKGRYQFSVSDNAVQRLFALTDLVPETAGARGTVALVIDYPNAGIYDELYFTGLALQTDAAGVTVVTPSMSTGTWKAARY